MKLKCPYCGSPRTQNVGGDNGNPFDRRPEKNVCLDCGRTVSAGVGVEDLLKHIDLSNGRRIMDKPCITIIRMYETFGGSGKSAYRTDIRKGKIPYAEMEKLYAEAPSDSSFEIVDVTDDTVSFVVDGSYLDSGKDEIHTLPLRGGVAIFKIVEERRDEIEGDSFTYEASHVMKVCTARRILNVYAKVTKQTENGEKSELIYKMLPYAPGGYDLGDEYPFSKNVYTGPDTGYSFRWLYVDDDMRIRYLDEDYRPAITAERGLGFVRKFGDETITINVMEEPWSPVLGDFI